MAGGFDGLVSQACARSKAACNIYKLALNSTVEDWRTFAVVQLEARAK